MKHSLKMVALSLALSNLFTSSVFASCENVKTPKQAKQCTGYVVQAAKTAIGKTVDGKLSQGKKNVASKRGW
jgi:hypothetical protein